MNRDIRQHASRRARAIEQLGSITTAVAIAGSPGRSGSGSSQRPHSPERRPRPTPPRPTAPARPTRHPPMNRTTSPCSESDFGSQNDGSQDPAVGAGSTLAQRRAATRRPADPARRASPRVAGHENAAHPLGGRRCRSGWRNRRQSVTNSRSLRLRDGWRSLRSACDSIWRIRSRVRPNSWPTSSSVRGRPSSRPKRSRRTRSSRPSRLSRTRATCSLSSCSATTSSGRTASGSSIRLTELGVALVADRRLERDRVAAVAADLLDPLGGDRHPRVERQRRGDLLGRGLAPELERSARASSG